MAVREDILRIFPEAMRNRWKQAAEQGERLQEIRLRAGRPVLLYMEGREYFLTVNGGLTEREGQAVRADRAELEELLSYVCSSSMYAYEEEISRGYLTLPGGHRMGLVGEAVLTDGGKVRNLKYVSGMNIRISHEIKGAADSLLPWVYEDARPLNVLILSPPGCGKTTLLRDLVRQISDGNRFSPGRTVGVVDERSEIAGSFHGMAQNDVGMRTDVLDGCPKAEGMMLLLRSMAPEVIAVDELGGEEELRSVRQALKCGCAVLATMHAGNIREAQERLFGTGASVFSRYVLLSGRGRAGEGRPERRECAGAGGRFESEDCCDREGRSERNGQGRSVSVLDGDGNPLWREVC